MAHQTVRKTYSKIFKENLVDEIRFSNEHAEYRKTFLSILKKWQGMWDDYLDHMTIAKYSVKLSLDNAQLIRSAPYMTSPRARIFEKIWTQKMLFQRVIEPAPNRWAVTVVFLPIQNGFLHFRVNNWKVNARESKNLAQSHS